MTFTMIIQLLIVLAALYVGSRYGSLALGAISGIGLAVLVFGFGLKPGTPPTDVIYIIIAASNVSRPDGGNDSQMNRFQAESSNVKRDSLLYQIDIAGSEAVICCQHTKTGFKIVFTPQM